MEIYVTGRTIAHKGVSDNLFVQDSVAHIRARLLDAINDSCTQKTLNVMVPVVLTGIMGGLSYLTVGVIARRCMINAMQHYRGALAS